MGYRRQDRTRTTGNRTGGPLRGRGIVFPLISLLIATMLMAPALAGAVTVDKTTAKSNDQGGNAVFGGVETRVTWEAIVEDGEDVSSIAMVLPDGSDVSDATVTLTVLEGLDRIDVDATSTFDGDTLDIDFAQPLAAGTLLRVEIYKVALPRGVDSATITGTYTTSTGTTSDLPESPAIALTDTSVTKTITTWLDQQQWVEAWNSVDILRTFFKPQLIVTSIPTLFFGWLRALALVLVGFPLAIPIGLLLALLKMGRHRVPRGLAAFYINVVRGTPLFLQIYIAFFGLPLLGVDLNSYLLGVLVLAMNSAAYLAEIFRAGIQSIHRGQFEAAASLGMSKAQTMVYVIIPQTIRRVIPTMTSEFILLYKDTSLLSAVGVMELMMFSKSLTANSGNMTPYIVAALYYLAVTLPLIKVVNRAERKLALTDGSAASSSKKPARGHGHGGGRRHDGDGADRAATQKAAWVPDAAEPEILQTPAGHDSL